VLRALRFIGGGGAGFFAREGGGGGAFLRVSNEPVSEAAQLDTLDGVLPCDVVGESDRSKKRSVRSGL
jgi:hypothetical protein